jgi:hypothetical protein
MSGEVNTVVHGQGQLKNNSKTQSWKMKEMIERENRNEHKLVGYIVENQENIYTIAVKYEFIYTTPWK